MIPPDPDQKVVMRQRPRPTVDDHAVQVTDDDSDDDDLDDDASDDDDLDDDARTTMTNPEAG